MSLFRGHSLQRVITSTRQSETKYQLLLQLFSGANRMLSSSKGDGKTTRSQEGAMQSCSSKNMPCRNAPELLIQWLSTKGSATLQQQKDNGQPSPGLARRNNSAWSDEASSDPQGSATAGSSWVGFGCYWSADSLVLIFRGSPHLVNPNPQFSLSKKAPHKQSNNF